MLTHVLMATQLFLGATSVYTPSDNPVAKLKTEPANLVSQLKAKVAKGDGEAAFKLYKIYLEDQNEPEWRAWLQKSVDLNYAEAEYHAAQVIIADKQNFTDEDMTQIIKYYLSSAEKGFAEAQSTLGDYYLLGMGFEKNEKEARKWYELAAKQNHGIATNNLARMQDLGQGGFNRDVATAIKLYSRAAYLGSSYAQTTMGALYYDGDVINKDNVEAFAWTWIGAETKSEYSDRKMDKLIRVITYDEYLKGRKRITEIKELMAQGKYEHTLSFKKNIDINALPTITKEDREIFKSKLAKAQSGNTDAQYEVASSYEYGDGVEESEKDAFYWYEKAAQLGHVSAQYSVGMIYNFGNTFVKPNYEEAFKWFEKAAAKNHPGSIFHVGYAYKNGEGVAADEDKGFEYYKKAADRGHADGQVNYANLHFRKCYSKTDGKTHQEICAKYLKMAAQQMNRIAFTKLAVLNAAAIQDQVEGLAWVYASQNCFADGTEVMETILEHSTPEQIEKAKIRGDQITKELLEKNKK
jgi:TPR repeat protein